jgi:hypothetical protein
MEKKTNRTEMVNDFMANGISMFSLMEPKTIPTEMKMVNDYQVKGQGICKTISFHIYHGPQQNITVKL